MDLADYIRLEIVRSKLSRGRVAENETVRIYILAYFEDSTISKSDFCKFKPGTIFKIPCDSLVKKLSVHLIKDDGDVRTALGAGDVDDIHKLLVKNDGDLLLAASIFPTTSMQQRKRVAKVQFKAQLRRMFVDTSNADLTKPLSGATTSSSASVVPPNFRFQPLTRKVNWDKVRNLNLDRIVSEYPLIPWILFAV